jgi:hypothetical protein
MFDEQMHQDYLIDYFKQKHNRFRAARGALIIERTLYRLEGLLQQDNIKVVTIDEEIKDKLKYLELYKSQLGASIEELNQKDPKIQFFKECRKSLDLALPLLDKIFSKTLFL